MREIGFFPEVQEATGGSSRSTVKRLIADPKNEFPRPFFVGGRLAWFMDEIEQWLESRPRRHYGG
jgi:predicted DNA-binding transcriptional regulator AlpA